MKFIIIFLFFCSNCFAIAFEDIDITGETNYIKQGSESLITTINLEYRIKLHEPRHKKYAICLGGIISPDYDHFSNEIKTNVFTTLGIDF